MVFIEKADGTIVDTDAKKAKLKTKEQELKNKAYEKHMAKVLNSAARNRTPYTPTQF